MSRGTRALLVFSLALNVALASAVITAWTDARRTRTAADEVSFPAEGGGWERRGGSPGGEGLQGRGADHGRGRRGGRHHGPGDEFLERWPGRRAERMGEALELSEEQRSLLEQRLGELRAEMRTVAQNLNEERQGLQDAFRTAPLDSLSVRSRARRVASLQAKLDSLVTEAMIRESAVLTPEQRKQYEDMEWGPGGGGPSRR